jgi:hypothetical protein
LLTTPPLPRGFLFPVIKYLIRTKVIVHWEKMNGVKHPELS